MENWKGIAGFPNYEVSDCGQVRSLPRLAKCGRGGMRSVVGGIKKLGRRYGYPIAALYGGGRLRTFTVHRLVLDAFRGPKPVPGMECRHLDGIRTNNRLSNLVWGTARENSDDKRKHGTMAYLAGEKHPRAKLTDKKVLRIRKLYATGEYTMAAIATAYGVNPITVHFIIHRKRWKHI